MGRLSDDDPSEEFLPYRSRAVAWGATNNVFVPYQARSGDEIWALRMNDFPDEPMYTLFVDGQTIANFTEWPPKWTKRETEQRLLHGAGMILNESEPWLAEWISSVAESAREY